MRTATERNNSSYKERGSEASMADSLGIKDAAKESSKGQNFKDADSDGTGSTQMDQMYPGALRAGDKQTREALKQDPPYYNQRGCFISTSSSLTSIRSANGAGT